MDEKPDKSGEEAKKAPPQRFEGTLPMGGGPRGPNPPRDSDGDLDLDLGDIQTRLPYGSEDIADK